MRYSARQLRCFEAVGITAWVERDTASGTTPRCDRPTDAAVGRDRHSPPGPRDADALAAWLRWQPVIALSEAGGQTTSDDSGLLVVLLSPDPRAPAPILTRPHRELLVAMLKAIGLSPGQVRLVAIAAGDRAEPLEQLLSEVQAVLFLYCSSEFSASDASARMSIGRRETPAWSCPHPAQLLNEPLAKRGAWESLKAIRRVLDVASAAG